MCRPGHVPLRDLFTGGHTGPPLHGVGSVPDQRELAQGESLPQRDGTEHAPCRGIRAGRCVQGGGVWSPRPTGATLAVPSNGPMWASAPTGRSVSSGNHLGQRRTAERLRRGREGWVEIAAEITPKGASNAGQSLSQPTADSSLYTREPFGTGDADCRVASLLAMTVLNLCHSEEAQRADVGICPFYDGRWTGVRAAPRKTRGTARRVVGPYGKPNQPPKPASAQRSARARGREGWAGIGAKTIPKGGPPPRLPGQRLAKRKARKEQLVKFGLYPMTSECSTAYNVRKSQQSPARAYADITLTEQNSLGPHPAARQGAPRP